MKRINSLITPLLSFCLLGSAWGVEPKSAPIPHGNMRDRNGSEIRRMNDLDTELKKCESVRTRDKCMDQARRRQNGM